MTSTNQIRKLAALDVVFHGPRLILAEFAVGVLLPLSLGLLALSRGRPSWQVTVLGVYLILLALNYVPLLAYAIAIVRKGSAHAEVADELAQKDSASKYMRLSLFLLVPLVIPVLALAEELRNRKFRKSG